MPPARESAPRGAARSSDPRRRRRRWAASVLRKRSPARPSCSITAVLKSGRPVVGRIGLRQPDEHRRLAAQIARESGGGVPAVGDERAAQQQVARQITDQRELGRDRQVGALAAGFARGVRNQPGVACEVADERVDLEERDFHSVYARSHFSLTWGTPARRPHRGLVNPTVSRLAVIAPNWLGDAVMALPAIADIRRASPDASLTIAARPNIAPVFQHGPGDRRGHRARSKRGRESFSSGQEKDSRPLFDAVDPACPTRFMRR